VGRYDDSLHHLTEARDLAVRLDNAWLTGPSQVLFGTLALIQGRLRDTQALLEEALDLSLAARSTHTEFLPSRAGPARTAMDGPPIGSSSMQLRPHTADVDGPPRTAVALLQNR
jgi:hypothetical protein